MRWYKNGSYEPPRTRLVLFSDTIIGSIYGHVCVLRVVGSPTWTIPLEGMPRPALLGGTVNRHDHLRKTLWASQGRPACLIGLSRQVSIRPVAQGLEMLCAPLERCTASLAPVRATEDKSRELVERKRGGMGTARRP